MQPSNYGQIQRNRRRTNSCSDKENVYVTENLENHVLTIYRNSDLSINGSTLRRCNSGPNMSESNGHCSNYWPNCSGYDRTVPYPSNCNCSPTVRCNCNFIPDQMEPCSRISSTNNLVRGEEASINSISIGDNTSTNGDGDSLLNRIRQRSGSWTGVNESDEDMEELASAYANQSMYHQSESRRNTSSNLFNTYQSTYQLNPNESNVHSDEWMRRQLKFFFMNPFEKWHAKRRFPWKLVMQIIKIIVVTLQLSMFASLRYDHVSYLWDTKVSFSHLFIKGWETSREINAYPPSNGPLALYRIDSFYEFIDYAVTMFAKIETEAIGTYRYEHLHNNIHMPLFCFSEYANSSIPDRNISGRANDDNSQHCLTIPSSILQNSTHWSMKEFLKNELVDIDFYLLLDAALSFFLHTTKIRINEPFEKTECYKLRATIFFNNRDHDGQMLVDMNVMATLIDCQNSLGVVRDRQRNPLRLSLSILTIVICCLSFIMCLRALYNAQILKNTTIEFFKVRFNRDLTHWEKFEFNNLWYVLICINDLLIVIGSLIKIGLESEMDSFDWSGDTSYQDQVNGFDYDGYLDKWNVCSLLLGMGNLLVWFGCLRYLGFFKTYNVLILTIKTCFPNVIRYSICISMVFSGYSFCGWLILGPYHLKFRSLSASIECLYSLVNGDDMFATFSALNGTDPLIWWFSRFYLYSFISLFIYVILSLFIAIIMDSYETIKNYYEKGFPCSQLRQFARECNIEPHSGGFMEDEDSTVRNFMTSVFCCCRRSHSYSGYVEIRS